MKKRSHSAAKRAGEQRVQDTDSLDNHTNLDWITGNSKRHRKDGLLQVDEQTILLRGAAAPEEIDAKDFYYQSHFFVGELSQEFCAPKQDGWVEMEEEPPSLNVGRWSDQEHQLFLEGLKQHGKDWHKVQAVVKTREVKNVISHAQKFLVKLSKFLDKGQVIEEMTVEEAEFYYGIISKRVHWMTRLKEERDKEKELKMMKGPIFRVDKVPKKDANSKQAEKEAEIGGTELPVQEQVEPKTCYDQWKANLSGNLSESFHFSLGCSIKVQEVIEPGQRTRIRLKQAISVDDGGDADSGTSQSSYHMRKYSVDGGFQNLTKPSSFQKLSVNIMEAIARLPDIQEGEEPDLMLKFGESGPTFNIFASMSVGSFLNKMYRQHHMEDFEVSHPNLFKLFHRKQGENFDKGVAQDESKVWPLRDYMMSLTSDDIDRLSEEGFQYYYSFPEEETGQNSEPVSSRMSEI